MLDIIQSTNGSGRQLYRVFETCPPLFISAGDGAYNPIRQIIVVAANYRKTGELFDWSAYMGIIPQHWGREEGDKTVAAFGNKLSIREVKFYLYGQPDLGKLIKRYRE